MSMKKNKGLDTKNLAQLNSRIKQALTKERGKALNYKQVASRLQISDRNDRERVKMALEILARHEEIEMPERGKYRYVSLGQLVEGRIDMTQSGAAYLITEGENTEGIKDVYISPKHLGRALDKDLVQVQLFDFGRDSKPAGEVVEIIERAKTDFAGILEIVPKKHAFLVADSRKMPVDIFVPLDKIGAAQHGDKVVVKMLDWPEDAKSPIGEVIKLLGKPGEHETEIHSILAEYDLPYEFPEVVERDAEHVPVEISDAEVKKRRDFRSIPTLTIDPVDAKDFDDALSIRQLENGLFEIGVHIADVTHYVLPGSKLEEEAQKRATSVYLVDRVVPMLPEKLSNLVCSLRPNEEKCTFSAVFEMDIQGKVHSEWFGRTLINSQKRFTYEEAGEVIKTGTGDMVFEVTTLNSIAKNLRAKRMMNGAIAFDKSEVRFQLDESNKPIGVTQKIMGDSNHLIEEFMLLANRKVAEIVGKVAKGSKEKKTMVYRIHDQPDPEKLFELQRFVNKFGYKINTSNHLETSKSINKMLAEVQGKGEANMIETLAIRTMAKAVYSTQNVGHYGLGFSHYTHFTSPIRRYPDMMVHRLLQMHLDGKPATNPTEWEELCKHSSNREKLASDAERSSIKYMMTVFMADKIGQVFDGIISGVTEWGVYVELRENKCEGMIKLRDFQGDYFDYDADNFRVIGKRTGKEYRLGDEITIRVKNADVDRKQIDFVPE